MFWETAPDDDLEKFLSRLRFHHEMLPAGFSAQTPRRPGCVVASTIKRRTGSNVPPVRARAWSSPDRIMSGTDCIAYQQILR